MLSKLRLTISYITEAEAIALLNNLPGTTRNGSRVVIRSFLEEWARDLDTTGVYEFDIFEKQ
jgi:hypothetical protein